MVALYTVWYDFVRIRIKSALPHHRSRPSPSAPPPFPFINARGRSTTGQTLQTCLGDAGKILPIGGVWDDNIEDVAQRQGP